MVNMMMTKTTSQQQELVVDGTIFSGEPTARALTLNHRAILGNFPVYAPTGEEVFLDSLLANNNKNTNDPTAAIVVFLRSLG